MDETQEPAAGGDVERNAGAAASQDAGPLAWWDVLYQYPQCDEAGTQQGVSETYVEGVPYVLADLSAKVE